MVTTARDLARQLLEVRDRGVSLAAGLDEQRATRRPGHDRWSVAETLLHVAETARLYGDAIERGMARLEPPAGPPGSMDDGHRLRLADRWFVALMEPPPRFRVPAPRRIRPLQGVTLATSLGQYTEVHSRLLEQLDRAVAGGLGRLRVDSPFVRLLRLSGPGAFMVLAAHGRRHLWQARRILMELGDQT